MWQPSPGIDGDKFMALYNEAAARPVIPTGETANPDNDVYYTDDPRYWEIAEWLHTVRTIDPNAQPWTFVRADHATDPNGFYYVVDGLALDQPLAEQYRQLQGTRHAIDGKLFTGLNQVLPFISTTSTNGKANGTSPATRRSRIPAANVVAGLGIDYLAQYIIDVENEISQSGDPGVHHHLYGHVRADLSGSLASALAPDHRA